MSRVKKLTSYSKKLTNDEREVEDLLATQQLNYQGTLGRRLTLSTVIRIIDFTDSPS